MRLRQVLPILLAALAAALLGLAASLALYGPSTLLDSPLGRHLHEIWNSPASARRSPEVATGEIVWPWQLEDIDGVPATIRPQGRPLLINYWASWCGPCRQEMPLLVAYSRQPSAVDLITIALDDRDAAASYAHGTALPLRVLHEAPGEFDSSVRLGNRRGVLPYTVLISANGRLLRRHYGAFDSLEELQDWAADF